MHGLFEHFIFNSYQANFAIKSGLYNFVEMLSVNSEIFTKDEFTFNYLPDNKSLALSKFKAFAN